MKDKIIHLTQEGLPAVSRPYEAIAHQLNTTEENVTSEMNDMLKSGAIRRIAAVPNHYKLGYVANGMTVWDVEDSKIDELGAKVGALDFVSHSYRRPRHPGVWNYNLFAMVHGKNKEECYLLAEEIKKILGPYCRANEILFSKRILKKTGFRKKNNSENRG